MNPFRSHTFAFSGGGKLSDLSSFVERVLGMFDSYSRLRKPF